MRRAALIGAVLVLGGISAGIAVASSSGGIVKHQVRSFALTGFEEQALDVGPSGDSPGDTFFFQEELRSLDLTKKLGRYVSACVLEESVKPRLNRCTATAFLEGGKVELAGRFKFSETLESFRLAVIGGTARYNNVVGHARVNFGCSACPEGHEGGMLTLNLIPSFERP